MMSIVACCHAVKLCAYAARDFQSQQDGAVTRMWRSCRVQPSHKERAICVVRCKKRGCSCNLSGGVALIVWFTRNGMYSKNNTVIYVARASNSKRDCNAGSVLLLAATMQSFAHMPLGISDHKSTKSSVCHPLSFWQTCALHSYTGFSLCQLKQENATIILIIII